MGSMIILSVAYGIHIQPQNDPNVEAAEKMMSVLSAASLPGAFLVVSFQDLQSSLPVIATIGCFSYTQIRPLLVPGCFLQAKSQGLEWDSCSNHYTSIYGSQESYGEIASQH